MYSLKYYDVEVPFPYPVPYQAQKSLIANSVKAITTGENALLESPTGTGKTLALLASALASQDYLSKKVTSEDENNNPPPRIWYLTRTHSQLKQLIGEYKQVPFTPQMAILASRKNTCIDHFVSQQKSDIDAACRLHHQIEHRCEYGMKGSHIPKQFKPEGDFSKFDLEDLKTFCIEHKRCPYLICREMADKAQLIFSPYDYIFDPQIRSQMKLQVQGSIIIVDEAHNIESKCRDIATLRLSEEELKTTLCSRIEDHLRPTHITLYPDLEKPFQILLGVFIKMADRITAMRTSFHPPSKDQDYNPLDFEDTMEQFGLTTNSWPVFSAAITTILEADSRDNSTDTNRLFTISMIKKLEEVQQRFGPAFLNGKDSMDDFVLVYKNGDERTASFQLLSMNSSVIFKPLAETAHSILLSSGTLTPMDTFQSELGVNFPIKLSANHVIDNSQVLSMIIDQFNGVSFNSSFRELVTNRREDSIYAALGELFITLLPTIPDGVLLFMPSNNKVSTLVETWKRNNLYEKISAIKPLYTDANNYKQYVASIEEGKGGFMIGVCQGTLSEGIDFADRLARAVFVFGIPFPSFKDMSIALKRRYNDTHPNMIKGDVWYETQALRALFQAFGRCIRHKNDYGAIMMIDERFENYLSRFPRWMAQSFVKPGDIGQQLNNFYQEMSVKFPQQAPKVIMNIDASVTLTCGRCTETLIPRVKFGLNDTDFIERKGFLSVAGCVTGQHVLVLKPDVDTCFDIGPAEWEDSDSIAYKKLQCPQCGMLHGVMIYAATKERIRDIGGFWLLLENIYLFQGAISTPIGDVVRKKRVITMEKGEKGQSKLGFFTDEASSTPKSSPKPIKRSPSKPTKKTTRK